MSVHRSEAKGDNNARTPRGPHVRDTYGLRNSPVQVLGVVAQSAFDSTLAGNSQLVPFQDGPTMRTYGMKPVVILCNIPSGVI